MGVAQKTEGFSGADLAELCQRAAKAAIRDAIAADELKAGDDAMDADASSEIGRKHFEEAFAGARRSVASNDLAKFDQVRDRTEAFRGGLRRRSALRSQQRLGEVRPVPQEVRPRVQELHRWGRLPEHPVARRTVPRWSDQRGCG